MPSWVFQPSCIAYNYGRKWLNSTAEWTPATSEKSNWISARVEREGNGKMKSQSSLFLFYLSTELIIHELSPRRRVLVFIM